MPIRTVADVQAFEAQPLAERALPRSTYEALASGMAGMTSGTAAVCLGPDSAGGFMVQAIHQTKTGGR